MTKGHARPAVWSLAAKFLAAVLLAAPADRTSAGEVLPAPEGAVVLTISGNIANVTDGATARFDIKLLESLPATTFRTTTIWTDGISEFTGVKLNDLLAYVDARGTELHATALDDYKVVIPVWDAVDDGPIIAYRRNGDYMSTRDR